MSDDKPVETQEPTPTSLSDIEAEEKAFHKGRGKMVILMILSVVGLGGVVGWYGVTSSRGESVRTVQRSINRLHANHYTPFWGCALREPVERYQKAEDLIAKLSKMATGSEKRYAGYIRTKCLPTLAPYRSKLEALPPAPDQYREDLTELAGRIDQVRRGWTDFVAYLESTEVDPELTPERAQLVAKGWYDYAKTRREIQDLTRELLGEDK